MASLLDRWLDGVEEGWGIPLLLAVFVMLWTAFLVLAYQNAGLHPDVIEAWVSGRTLDWGGAKHPPLMGWVTHLWMLVFPVRDCPFTCWPWSMQRLHSGSLTSRHGGS